MAHKVPCVLIPFYFSDLMHYSPNFLNSLEPVMNLPLLKHTIRTLTLRSLTFLFPVLGKLFFLPPVQDCPFGIWQKSNCCNNNWVYCNTVWCSLLSASIKTHNLRAQSSIKPSLLQMPVILQGSPDHLYFWSTGYKFRAFFNLLRFNNKLEWPTELRKKHCM